MKKRSIALLLSLLMLLPLCLTGCRREEGQVVNVYNWGEYIDESIFEDFEAQTGIHVNYNTFASNEMLYSSIKSGSGTYDVIIPSDYMVARMKDEGLLLELDYSQIPNFSNMDPRYTHLEYDPEQLYSIPYMWGTVGIIYNVNMVDQPITRWMDLFDENRGWNKDILMFDNSRDCIGIALKALGYSYNTTDPAQLQQAADLLIRQKENGMVQAYVMDQIFDKMINDEAAVGVYYAGDYLTMLEENEDLVFVLPEEGSNLFVDAMCVPTSCANYDNAMAFINFMCEDEIVVRNCEETWYSAPSATALAGMDSEMSEDPIMYPDDDVLAKCETYAGLPEDTLLEYDRQWINICLAKVKPKKK